MGKKPFVLWLVWQNQETRQRYHIGNLTHVDGEYSFSYERSGKRRTLNEAMENGYNPHVSFRDINKNYVSDRLFGPFARRLPDKRRPDFNNILKEYGLTLNDTELDLLRATGGRLATDPYEFVAPITLFEDYFSFDFYIAGWRYYNEDKIDHQLTVGEGVIFELDPTNKEDNKAVIVLSDNQGRKLGYIPAFYSGFMSDILKNNEVYEAKIDQVNLHAKPQLKVNISVVGKLITSYTTTKTGVVEPLQLMY